MAEVLLMPRLSDTMTEGVIASWNKKVGDTVKKGDVLAEIETDKATMELESYHNGTLLYIGVDEGGKLAVNDLMAIIGEKGEDIADLIKKGGDKTEVKAETDVPETEKPAPVAEKTPETKSTSTSLDLTKVEEVVLMPRLSDTMTDGVIASWVKEVGDAVKKGDVLAEIETDKATMELESYKDGILLYQGANAGEKIEVNNLLAIIGPKGFDIQPILDAAKGGSTAPAEEEKAVPAQAAVAPAPQKETAPVPAEVVNDSGRILASPLAKKIAEDKGIDLKYVKGSGDNGRITKNDVEGYTPQQAAASAAPSAAPVFVPAGQESFEDVPVTQMRKVIAKRLAESKFTSPHFYVTMSVDMDAAVAARPKLNGPNATVKISFNDIVIKAVAAALKQHPDVNSSWLGDKIRINHHVHIGVAVAVPDGLVVPVIKFADALSLTQISTAVKTYAVKAKDKKIAPGEMEGSTFTISNLGMYGVDQFTGIINPPNACILAVGGISQVPVVKNGQVVVGNVMKLTLSSDHRVVDGAKAAEFLKTLKELLEEPLRLLL